MLKTGAFSIALGNTRAIWYNADMAYKLVKTTPALTPRAHLDVSIGDVEFTALDLETTGTKPPDDRIIEIGAVRVRNFEILDSYRRFVNPGRTLPPFISRLTGITDRELAGEPFGEEVLPGLLEFLGDSVIVAHHAPFDHKFLSSEVRITLKKPLRNAVLCTCKLARRILHFLPSKGLDAVTNFLGIPVNGRHRALGDAEATAKILVIFLRYLEDRGITTLGRLLDFQNSKPSRSATDWRKR